MKSGLPEADTHDPDGFTEKYAPISIGEAIPRIHVEAGKAFKIIGTAHQNYFSCGRYDR
jgi:hypothetical protein